jgi:6-phosphogluconolactonase (cycloisomerase 2 family)
MKISLPQQNKNTSLPVYVGAVADSGSTALLRKLASALIALLFGFFLFFTFASHAHAALSYVGGTGNVGTTGSFSVSLTALTGGTGSTAQEGDLVLVLNAIGGATNGNPGVSTAGFTEEQDLYADDSNDANLSVSWKFMTASPDTSVSCNGSGSGTVSASCIVYVWRGVDPTTPFDVAETVATGINSAIPNPASITPTTAGSMVVIFGAGALASSDITVTAPTGYVEMVNISSDAGSAIISAVASKEWSGSGAEDPAAWTDWSSGTAGSWAAVTVALRPAANFSGTLYSDEGTTAVTTGKTVKVAIGTTTPISVVSATTDSSGVWTVTPNLTGVTSGTPVVAWVDGDPATYAAVVTRASGATGIAGLDLYADHVILRHEDSGPLTLDDLAVYDGDNDHDIPYIVRGDSGTLFIEEDQKLYIWSGDSFTGATTTILGGDLENNGTLDLGAGSTEFASDSIVSGSGITFGDVSTGSSSSQFLPNGNVWTPRSAAAANSWQSVTYGEGLFVGVSSDGTYRVMTSPDGITWTVRSAAAANSWQDIAYGNGMFVAVSRDGTDRVMTSPDGITWTARSVLQSSWDSVTYGNGMFVAVACGTSSSGCNTLAGNRVMTSEDGVTWISGAAAEANLWDSVTYGNGLFVAVSSGGTNRVMTSPDGTTWTARSVDANNWNSVVYGNGLFVAVSEDGTNRVMTSPDGITWTGRTAAEANTWQEVTYGEGLFVAVAATTTSTTTAVMTSSDGFTWTARSGAEANSWRSVTYASGLFVAVSSDGTNRVMTSDSGVTQEISSFENNGATWTARSASEAASWRAITYGNGMFVAVSTDATNRVMTSEDGVTWTGRSASAVSAWRAITYGNGMFVALAHADTTRVMTSPDGVTWTSRTAAAANTWRSITYGDGLFVAVSQDGTNRVMTSPDGITWTARSASAANAWFAVTYGNGLFVAVSSDGTNRVMTSPDGITWTGRTAAEDISWRGVTYGEGLFVAVASDGTNRVMTSPDGITWTARSASEANQWNAVAYGGGLFIAVADSGTNRVMTSEDGFIWTAASATQANSWFAIAYGEGKFVATSFDGTNRVMTSDSGSYANTTQTFSADATINNLTITASSTVVAPSSLTLNGDYANDGTFTAGDGTLTVAVENTTVGYDLANATYDSVSKTDIGDTGPSGLHFRSDGLKMYTYGFGSDLVREFTLSSAWDLSTASQVATYNASAQGTWSNDVTFNDDGTKMYLTGDDANAVLEYALSTPWSISSGVTYTDSTSVSAKETSPFGVEFSSDGTKMYVSGAASDAVHTYTLSTPWDASTASFLRSYSVAARDTEINGLQFSTDGTELFVTGLSNSSVFKYTLSTAWEVSSTSATYTGESVSLTPRSEFQPVQVAFKADGTKMYVYGFDTQDMFQYTTGVEGTGTPDTDKVFEGNMTGDSAFNTFTITAEDSEVTFNDSAETGSLTIGSTATVTAPVGTLTVNGDLTNNGVFDENGGTLIAAGNSSISGNLTGSSALGNLTATTTGEFYNTVSTWEEESASAAAQWSAVTYGGGTFVAVSWDGNVMSSPDGITWTNRTPAEGNSWQTATYGNGLFVALSNTGTNRVMTSPDGITWTARAAVGTNNWIGAAYGNGRFVAVACGVSASSCNTTAGGYRIMTSEDGTTWTGVTAPEANQWKGITYGEGLFVAVADTGTNRVMTSPDGTNWTVRTASSANGWQEVVYAEGRFVAVSETDTAMSSEDGITWTARTTPGNSDWYGLAYGGGYFAALGDPLTGTTYIMTSPDGITWTEQSAPNTNFFISLTYGEGKFVSASTDGTNRVLVSSDGTYDSTVTLAGNASTTDFTIGSASTTLVAPALLSVADDYTNDGAFTHNNGTVYFSGATAQTLSGEMTSTSAFNDVIFSGASTKTFTDNATTSDLTIVSDSTVVAPNALTVHGDYTNNGTFTHGSGLVYITGTTTASTTPGSSSWDITTATYDGAAFSVTAQEGQVTSLAFSADGTRMYVAGYGSDTVFSYTLSTAWDVTTASYDSISKSLTTQDSFIEKIAFKSDGTKLYALGSGNDRVFQYTLSNPWEVDTATYDSVSALVNQDASPFGLFIRNDGLKMYIAGNTNDRIYSYTLSSAWDMSTASYDSQSFLISGQETAVQDVAFNDDGTEMYTLGYTADTINQYSLSTPWNVTTAVHFGSKSITAQETTPDGLEFKDDGSKVYVHGESASDIFPYSIDSSADETIYVGTTTLSGNMIGTSAFNDLTIDAPQLHVPDGTTWIAQNAAEANTWTNITYGEGLFVAISYSGTNRVMTSPDGITWTARTAPSSSWNSVTYGDGTFVAVGTSAVMSSPDGITWTARTASQANDWNGVAYGNGVFVAVSLAGTNRVMTSPDGTTWTNRTAAAANSWQNVTYGEGLFVAVSSDGTDKVMTSPDGITWTSRTTVGSAWYGIAYGNGTFVATAFDNVMTSEDGITWTQRTNYPAYSWQSVGFGGGLFVAVADGTAAFMTSTDGIDWTERTASAANQWWDVAYGNNTFVAVAKSGTNRVNTSVTGDLFGSVVFEVDDVEANSFVITEDTSVLAPETFAISGDYTNDGTIDWGYWGSSTTTFNGTGAQTATGTMTGTSAFDNLVILNVTATTSFETALEVDNRLTATSSVTIEFPAGATTTVASFNVVGTSGNEITLRSTQTGTQWGLDATAHNVYFVDVKDSNACSGNGNITATSSTDSGNNDCWTIIAPVGGSASISSASNQVFGYGQATTSIAAITITDNSTPTITVANDIRIAIATSTVNMRWNTTDTTAVFSGTASGKVSTTVSYEGGGSVLVIPVTTNFAASDTLTISGLSFAQFGTLHAASAEVLQLRTDGVSDTNANDTDDKTIGIHGLLTLSNHSSEQVSSTFSYQNQTEAELFAYRLVPAGESANFASTVFTLSGVRRIDDSNLSSLKLFVDNNSNKIKDAADTQIGGSGVLAINGQSGTVTFGTAWSATTSKDYVLIADVSGIKPNEYMTVTLLPGGTITGVTTGGAITYYGSASPSQHIRGGNNGSGALHAAEVGGEAPAGDGDVSGGGDDGGGGVGEEDDGETIGNAPGFEAPAATGELYSEWTNGSNALSSDGAYATAASTNLRQSYSVFGFNVPNGNTVQGIEVKLEASGSTAAGTIQVALSWNGDSSVTATKATSVLTGSDAVYTLGGPSDTWGRSWTPAELSNANFFVRVIGQPDQNTVRVDAIQVRPYSQAGGGGGGGGGEI